MAKINWGDTDLTPDDIDEAEDSYQPYTGSVPPGGVYRFKVRRVKYTEFESGNKGFTVLLILDGSWKKEHRQYDGAPVWDRQTMTKSAAGFLKAFAAALGVSSTDLLTKAIKNDDDVVTKIGRLVLVNRDGEPTEPVVYVNCRRGTYNEEPRLERAGAGYLVMDEEEPEEDEELEDEELDEDEYDEEDEEVDEEDEEDSEEDEDEEDEDEDEPEPEPAPRRAAKKTAAKAAPAKRAAPAKKTAPAKAAPAKRAPRNANEARAASKATPAKASARSRRRSEDDEPPF